MNILQQEIMSLRNEEQAVVLRRFFRTGKGEYGEGDKFLGVKVPQTRAAVKHCWRSLTEADFDECVCAEFHEVRLGGLLALVQKFRREEQNRAWCVDFYLSHTAFINNWDLVDLSCYDLLGVWLLTHDRAVLYRLAEEDKTLWENRIAIVSTMQFLRHGQTSDTYALAEKLLRHPHDLMHKAVGWLLREAGKRCGEDDLKRFVSAHYAEMPRTTLRYAIERFPEPLRQQFLKGDFSQLSDKRKMS